MIQIYVDTSFILSILLETGRSSLAEHLLEEYQNERLVTSGIAISETFYVATYEYYKKKKYC